MVRLRLQELVDTQRSERYRTVIVHGDAAKGKTRTAQALARIVPDATYVDVLRIFCERPKLAAQVDRFGPADLERLLLAEPASGQVVIVDHLDVILNTWTPAQKRSFAQWVDDGLDGFTDSLRVLIFFIQTDNTIVDYPMRRPNRLGRTRVFHMDDFYAL